MGRCLRWVYRWQVATSLTFDFENPLRFSFPPEVDADSLMQGAMQLSQADAAGPLRTLGGGSTRVLSAGW